MCTRKKDRRLPRMGSIFIELKQGKDLLYILEV